MFRTELEFRDLNRGPSSGIKFLLLSDLVYESPLLNRRIVVPAKFVTDMASIPQFLWNVLPPIGSYDAAAVVHDYLYLNNGVTRKQADDVLNEAMGELEVAAWKRRLIYAGVLIGGWLPWSKYRESDEKAVTSARNILANKRRG